MDGDSNSSISFSILILLLLFGFAAYFALCETAFASVSPARLRSGAERGDRRAKRAVYITERFDQAITTILIGTNITHLTAASYVTVLVTRRWDAGVVTLSTIAMTIAMFFLGEMLPKSIAKKYSERISLGTADSLYFFMRVFSPVASLLTMIGNQAAKLAPGENEVTVTENELYDIIETMTDAGNLDAEQGELVLDALSFADVTAVSVLTARVDIVALDVKMPPEEIITCIKTARHSRLPVYEGSVDNIIGVLQVRKYIKAWLEYRDAVELRPLLDEPYFVHQSINIDELLSAMSAKKLNMAIVTDNYGGTLGLVTVEDILEELVGEIWDEEDVVQEPCVDNGDGSCSFDASVAIDDAFAFMGYEDPDEFDFGHKLLGEWTYEQFERLPAEGDSFVYNTLRITVEKIDHRRILKLRLAPCPAAPTEEAAGK